MARLRIIAAGWAISLACAAVMPERSAADTDGTVLHGFPVVDDTELAGLTAREGRIHLHGEQNFTIESRNDLTAGSVESGLIGLNNSFDQFRGINNVTANTGNNANVQGGLNVIINMY